MKHFRVHVYAHVRCPVEVQTENDSMTPEEAAEAAMTEFLNDADRFVRSPLSEYAEDTDDEVVVDEVVSKDETIYHGTVNVGGSGSGTKTVTMTVEELEQLADWAATGIAGWEDDDGEELDDDQRATKAEAEEFVDAIYDRIEAAKKK